MNYALLDLFETYLSYWNNFRTCCALLLCIILRFNKKKLYYDKLFPYSVYPLFPCYNNTYSLRIPFLFLAGIIWFIPHTKMGNDRYKLFYIYSTLGRLCNSLHLKRSARSDKWRKNAYVSIFFSMYVIRIVKRKSKRNVFATWVRPLYNIVIYIQYHWTTTILLLLLYFLFEHIQMKNANSDTKKRSLWPDNIAHALIVNTCNTYGNIINDSWVIAFVRFLLNITRRRSGFINW